MFGLGHKNKIIETQKNIILSQQKTIASYQKQISNLKKRIDALNDHVMGIEMICPKPNTKSGINNFNEIKSLLKSSNIPKSATERDNHFNKIAERVIRIDGQDYFKNKITLALKDIIHYTYLTQKEKELSIQIILEVIKTNLGNFKNMHNLSDVTSDNRETILSLIKFSLESALKDNDA